MFVRLRWFVLGVLSTLGGGAYVLAKLRRMRARLSPRNLAKASTLAAADALSLAGKLVAPKSGDQAPG